MGKIVKFILFAVLIALLIAGASMAYGQLSTRYSPEAAGFGVAGDTVAAQTRPGDEAAPPPEEDTVAAPDFTVYDAEGNAVSLSDFAGKPVVVNFWATWCPPCKAELPDFEDAWRKYGEDVTFLFVNLADSRDTTEVVEAFMEDGGYEFPLYYDTDGDAAYAYGIYSIPVSLFVDAEGNLEQGYIGALNAEVIESCIGRILEK